MSNADKEYLFKIETPIGFSVSCSKSYWEFIITQKHPILGGHESDVEQTLKDPDEIRRSRKDITVFLFYRSDRSRWLCVVVRREDGSGFLITAYPTDAIKMGEIIWKKSK